LKTRLGKFFDNRFFPVLLLLGHLVVIGILLYFIDYYSKTGLENILMKWIPVNLHINFFLVVSALIFCLPAIREHIKNYLNRKGILIAAFIAAVFMLSSFFAPRDHRIYYDEDIYANIGQNIALKTQTGLCNYGTFEYEEYYPHSLSYNKEPSGWPYLISLLFQVFGVNELYAFFLNNFLFTGSVMLAYLITWHMTGNFYASFFSSLIFGLIPQNLMWGNTIAAEPAAAFFAGLSFLALILYLKTYKTSYLFLLMTLLPFSCQMRPESGLIIPVLAAYILLFSPGLFADRKFWAYLLFAGVLIIPHLVHLYAVSGHSWGAEESKFALSFFSNNFSVNGLFYINNKEFPAVFTTLAFSGLIFSKESIRQKACLMTWFILFCGIFLFFYAGSYHYGADVRFSLLTFLPLAILAGTGADEIRRRLESFIPSPRSTCIFLMVFLILFSAVRFFNMVHREGQEAWGARYDHKYAKEFIQNIPKRSIVLSQNPAMFLLWGQNSIQTYSGIEEPELIKQLIGKYQGHVYFHYNYWCNTKNIRNIRLCDAIKEKYVLTEVATAREQDHKYGLYKISLKDEEAKAQRHKGIKKPETKNQKHQTKDHKPGT